MISKSDSIFELLVKRKKSMHVMTTATTPVRKVTNSTIFFWGKQISPRSASPVSAVTTNSP